jgi:hypothetical protein
MNSWTEFKDGPDAHQHPARYDLHCPFAPYLRLSQRDTLRNGPPAVTLDDESHDVLANCATMHVYGRQQGLHVRRKIRGPMRSPCICASTITSAPTGLSCISSHQTPQPDEQFIGRRLREKQGEALLEIQKAVEAADLSEK